MYQAEPGRTARDLLRDADGGDQVAFEEFCRRYLPRLRRYLGMLSRTMGFPATDVDDHIQETLIKALGFVRRSNPGPEVGMAWLQRVAYRVVIDSFRRRKVTHDLEDFPEPAAETEELEEILELFEWLSQDDRELLENVFLKGMTVREAGEFLELSQAAVYKRFERAIAHLQNLHQYHGTAVGSRGEGV